ncbi:hypothetical protein RZS08_66885, partial [Arthrospira platensis SPKY1]|nr:hypothetical protein [Arthrospira platensis SPKY1]
MTVYFLSFFKPFRLVRADNRGAKIHPTEDSAPVWALKNLRKLFFWPTFEGMKKTLFCAFCSCLALAALGQP